MKNIQTLMQEIIALSSNMETNFPELYKNLSETPLMLHDTSKESVNMLDLENYLQTLKKIMRDAMEANKLKRE